MLSIVEQEEDGISNIGDAADRDTKFAMEGSVYDRHKASVADCTAGASYLSLDRRMGDSVCNHLKRVELLPRDLPGQQLPQNNPK